MIPPHIEALLLHRSEPQCRAVLEDWLREHGRTLFIDVVPCYGGYGDYSDGDGGYGDGGHGYSDYGSGCGGDGYGGDGDYSGGGRGGRGDGYGDGGHGGDGDGGSGYGGDGSGYGGGGYGDGGHGDGGHGGDGDGGSGYTQEDPVDGLVIVSIGGGMYPYVLVGWCTRVDGDEYDMHGARCLARFGKSMSLAELAASGPRTGDGPTKLLPAAVRPERIHRLHVRRCLPCSEEAWAEYCPRPEMPPRRG